MATYNYGTSVVGHFFLDMLPYYLYGNSWDDPTNFYERVTGTYDGCEEANDQDSSDSEKKSKKAS